MRALILFFSFLCITSAYASDYTEITHDDYVTYTPKFPGKYRVVITNYTATDMAIFVNEIDWVNGRYDIALDEYYHFGACNTVIFGINSNYGTATIKIYDGGTGEFVTGAVDGPVEDCCGCTDCDGEFEKTSSSLDEGGPNYKRGYKGGSLGFNFSSSSAPSNVSDPKHLVNMSSDNEEEVIRDSSDVIYQIKTDSGLTQVDTVSADSYTIKQYTDSKVGAKDGNGHYTTTGSADSTVTFSKTSGSPNTLTIEETQGGSTVRREKFAFASSKWTHSHDIDVDNTYDRHEYQSESTSGSNTIKTHVIEDSSNTVVRKVERTYDSNNRLTKEVVDPSGLALTTEYTYDTNGNMTRVDNPDGSYVTYTYTTNDEVELTTYSSGRFSKNEYDTSGRVTKTISSFDGSTYTTTESDHRVVTYSYTAVMTGDDGSVKPDEPREVIVKLKGNTVSKTWYGYLSGEDIVTRAATPTSALSDTANLTSYTYYNTSGTFKDKITKIINEDGLTGTMVTYSESGTTVTTTTETGAFNSGQTAIVNGTEEVVVVTDDLEVSTHVFDVDSGLLISSRTVATRDYRDRETRVNYHDGTYEEFTYSCCNLDNTKSRDAVVTYYTYDSMDRLTDTEVNGVTNTTVYDILGQVIRQEQTDTSETTTRTLVTNTYDAAGRLASTKDALNNTTSFSETYSSGTTTRTTTFPNSKTQIVATNSEGEVTSVSGTGVHAQGADVNEESVELDSTLSYYVLVTKTGKTNRWTKTYEDALGRVYKTETSAGAISKVFYDSDGNVEKTEAANGAVTLYYNDVENGISIQALDVNQNDVIDYGTDVISRTDTDYVEENEIIYQRIQSWNEPSSLATPGTADNINKVSNDGFARINTSNQNGISSTFEFRTTMHTNGIISTTVTAPDGSYTKSEVEDRLQKSVKLYSSDDVLKNTTTYTYDTFNRLKTQVDSRNGTSTYSYDDMDRVTSLQTTDPDDGGSQTAQTFSTVYDNMGRRSKVKNPDNSEILFTYTDQGQIYTSTGANVYPRQYSYDSEGRLTKLETWKDYTNLANTAQIEWVYNTHGQLTSEKDDSGKTTSYTYNSAGQVATKTNARGAVKTYTYDSNGRLSSVSYSDSTPTVSYTYNNLGQVATVTDAAGSRDINYNSLGQYTGQTWTSGSTNGLDETYSYDSIGRQQSFSWSLGTDSKSVNYTYDTTGRLSKVTSGDHTYEYSYLTDSPFTVEKLQIKKDGRPQIYSKRTFDKLMRTTGYSWKTGQE